MEKGIKSVTIIELKADCYLPGGMPLANVNVKGGIAINEATAKAPPAVATGAAKRLRTSWNFEQECVLQGLLSLPDPEQFPPFFSALVLVRDLVSVPPPQVFEQDPQVDQRPQTQSTGNKKKYF